MAGLEQGGQRRGRPGPSPVGAVRDTLAVPRVFLQALGEYEMRTYILKEKDYRLEATCLMQTLLPLKKKKPKERTAPPWASRKESECLDETYPDVQSL